MTFEILPSIRKIVKYENKKLQKSIELDHSNKLIELNNKLNELNNEKLKLEMEMIELELKENDQKIEMKKLALIDNNESRYDVIMTPC